MDRIRLTKRASRGRVADSATPETAIDLGKNRTYHKIDEYHTFEPTLNHWEPDMRHEWKDNPREETGHGIPKMAKVYIAAKKATKLAALFLGEKATEEEVERQARAFMRMGDRALTSSLNLYAECKGDGCNEEPAKVCTGAEEEACTEPTTEAPKAEEAPVKPVAVCTGADEQADAEPTTEAPEAEQADDADEVTEAPEAEQADAEPADVEVGDASGDAEIEFDDAEDGADTGADPELEEAFSDDEVADEGEEEAAPAGETTTRKAGVKRLAGQPTLTRVASKKADDLAGIWDKWENPDVR